MTVIEAIEWLETSWEEGLDAVFNDDTADWFVNLLFNFLEGN